MVACSTVPPAPVDHRRQPPSKKISTHEVAKGETLFSIAWAYGLDYRGLARANGIGNSYTIHPGQVLKLTDDVEVVAPRNSGSKASAPPAVKTPAATASTPRNPVNKPVIKNIADGEIRWLWPASGKIIQGFSAGSDGNKGIDLAGKLGDAVAASAAGKVVYAGTGLVGYGQLIIIKHNDRFLTAYAHNRVMLVKEGESVKAGQKIAEIGSSGVEKVKLHFEIRRDGKPVDPEAYLPQR